MPETYKFARGETRQALLTVMAKAQAKAVDEIWKKRAPDLPIKSPGELVTLASVVEKETGKVEERPRVAGVFVNRLQKHMKLQSDPTIVYGLVFGKGTLGHPITRAELDQATPYNTYNIEGLPPGPICNPGKAALEAVANPSRTKDLYFVADGTGGHAFAETLDQHQKNVAHWRQIEKDAKDRLAPDAAPPGAPGRDPRRDRAERSQVVRRACRPCRRRTPRPPGALADETREARRIGAQARGAARRGRIAVGGKDRGQVDRGPRRGRHRRQRRAGRGGIPGRRRRGLDGAGGERSAVAGRLGRSEGARGALRQCDRRRLGAPAGARRRRPAADGQPQRRSPSMRPRARRSTRC